MRERVRSANPESPRRGPRFRPILHIQLAVNALKLRLDGVDRDHQRVRQFTRAACTSRNLHWLRVGCNAVGSICIFVGFLNFYRHQLLTRGESQQMTPAMG